MRHLKYYLILLFLALSLITLGQVSAETYLIGSVEDNSVRYEKKQEGFAISLPPSWAEFNLDKKALTQTLNIIKEKNPNIDKNYEALFEKIVEGGYIKFFAYDGNSLTSGFLTNINVMKEQLKFEISLDVYIELTKAQLEKMLNPVTNRRIKTNSGEAEVLYYKIITGNQVVAITQIIAVKGKEAFVVTLSTSESQAEKYSPVFEKIGQSFEVFD